VVRIALVLLALGGCDYAFGIKKVIPPPAPCGPFLSVTEVPITGVTEPRGFSISADEQLALVTGKDSNGVTRPIPLHWNGSAWAPDPAMQGGLMSGMKGANLAPSEPMPDTRNDYTGPVAPVMLLSSGQPLAVARYYLSNGTWTMDTNEQPFTEPSYDVLPGNVVLVAGSDPFDRVRHTVLTFVALDPTMDQNQIQIAANSPPSFTLLLKNRTDEVNSTGLGFGQSVMTEDKSKLVFSAKSGAQYDLFASAQDDVRNFQAGGLIKSLDTDDDEVEPWIDATCSKLYFRRVPAGQPNAAGQIYVAE